MSNRTDLSNIFINFLKKKRYERLIAEGQLQDNQFYAVTDGNEKCEYGELYGNIEDQIDLYNALYASRLFKMEMCNDPRGYDIVHKLYDRREFDLSKFTVVGNPVISKDGIASGFTDSDYIDFSKNFLFRPGTNTWEIITKIKTPVTLSEREILYGFCSSISINGRFGLYVLLYNNHFNILNSYNGISWAFHESLNGGQGTHNFLLNTDYYLKYSFTGDYYILSYSFDGINYTEDIRIKSSNYTYNNYGASIIGRYGDRGRPFKGSVYLKDFSITVDGEEVFNGLKDLTQYDTYTLPSSEVITIPYIPSVDGIKIVDVQYKDRVDNLYTLTGKDNYIIIDETNEEFRLPLQDIYSQLEEKTAITLRKWED